MALCCHADDDGMCAEKAYDKTAFCKKHSPTFALSVNREVAEIQKKEAQRLALKERKADQRREIALEKLDEAVLEIQDLEGLRRFELMLAKGLINGSIDPRAGSPIISVMKHQQELLEKTEKDRHENLSSDERTQLFKRADEMTLQEALNLLADFKIGFASLAKQAKKDVVEAEVRVID